jgi:RND family efflux transporter MFP subunit
MHRWVWLSALFPGLLLAAGCARNGPPAASLKPPEVLVSQPVVREVTDYEIFTGRTEAFERVEIRARVTGYLEKTLFTEGALVQEGDLLFQIDPRPYQAELARAEAALTQAQARVDRLNRDYQRAQALLGPRAISREEFDRMAGERDEARAAVGVAESNVRLARLNVEYTEVRAPFAGRISRRLVDPGNLVKADETVLTTLVSLEPMYVYFDVDERTLLRQLLRAGRLDSASQDKVPIEIGLADEEGYPHPGVVNFVDNRVDPNTGSLWMRGEFVHPDRPIKPGIFARVRFPLGGPYPAVLVAEQALGTDQGQKFVYVVDEKNRAVYRPVKAGRLHGGLRVIQDGLKPGERVVVSGLQRVRAGAEVTPKATEMSTLAAVPRPRAEELAGPPAAGQPPPALKGLTPPAQGPPAPRTGLAADAKTESGS